MTTTRRARRRLGVAGARAVHGRRGDDVGGGGGPRGVQRGDRVQRARRPDGGAVRPRRPGVRRREARHDPDVRLRRPTRPPTQVADLRTEVYNFWDRGLLGLAIDPGFPDPALPVRAVHVRRRDRRLRPALGHAPTPTATPAPRTRARRPAAASPASSWSGSPSAAPRPPEQDLVHDWCQQYPSHSAGDLRLRPGRRAVRLGGGRRQLRVLRLRPGRRARQPVRRPGCGERRDDTRRAPRAGHCGRRTCGRPATRSGWTARSSASTRTPARRLPGQPARRQRRPERRADRRATASATRSAWPCGPGPDEVWVADVG